MQALITYLVESFEQDQLKHLEHPEDFVFSHGDKGFRHAAKSLEAVHNTLSGKADSSISVKYDGCVASSTRIIMADGLTSTIEEITASWCASKEIYVLGVNAEGKVIPAKIIDKLVHEAPKQWVTVETLGGNITLTADHPVYTPSGWKPAGELEPGDDILEFQINK